MTVINMDVFITGGGATDDILVLKAGPKDR